MSSPRVSVIMPVYNAERYLRLAVESIIQQTFTDFELIIVDDGSTDGSRQVINSISDPRIIKLFQDNLGYPQALNVAVHRASGEYVARMDADDVSHPERIEKQVAFLDRHSEFVFVGTAFEFITPNGKFLSTEKDLNGAVRIETWETVFNQKHFGDPTVIFRKSAAALVGNYRTYQKTGQDMDLWLRLLEGGVKAAVLESIYYSHRMSFSSISNSPLISAWNSVPRLLALQRLETGSDGIMRGEGVESLITPEMIAAATNNYQLLMWDSAHKCVEAGDIHAGLKFASAAVGIKRARRANITHSLRILRGVLSGPRVRSSPSLNARN